MEHFRMGWTTEKRDCHIKYRDMKDFGLSFDIVFFVCTGSLKTETAYPGFSGGDCNLKGKNAHRPDKHGSIDLVCFVLFLES